MQEDRAADGLPELVSTEEAARRLGVTRRTIYRLINSGELRAHRIGRVMRVPVVELGGLLERETIAPGSLGHLLGDA